MLPNVFITYKIAEVLGALCQEPGAKISTLSHVRHGDKGRLLLTATFL